MQLTPEKRRQWGRWAIGIAGFLVVWTGVALVFPLLPSPWPPFYWALPVHGQVVMAYSKIPLEGVSVVAHWELEGPWGITLGQLAVMESVTDKEGRFSFSWWHPRLRSPLSGRLESNAPALLFFKNGYKRGYCNNDSPYPNLNPFPASDCNDTVVQLQKFEGTDEEYTRNLHWFDNRLESIAFKDGSCRWKHIPHMLVALHQERLRLDARGLPPSIFNHNSLADWEHHSGCGPVQNYLRSYLP